MDQTFEELQAQRARRGSRARAFDLVFHRALLLLLAALFIARSVVARAFWAVQVLVLVPYAAAVCMAYKIWAIDKQVCGSDLSLGAVYSAFWAGDRLVLGTGLESFLLRAREDTAFAAAAAAGTCAPSVPVVPAAPGPTPETNTLTLTKHQMNAITRLLRSTRVKSSRKRAPITRGRTSTLGPSTLPRRFHRFRKGTKGTKGTLKNTLPRATATLPRRKFRFRRSAPVAPASSK